MTSAVLIDAFVGAVVAGTAIELVLRWMDMADPPTFQKDPHCGYRLRPDQSVSTRGYRFRINNVGLRGEDISSRKANELRIAFIGDSITYAGGKVPDPDLFTTRVGKAIGAARNERVLAVNISAPGWGIQNMTGFIGAFGIFECDVVVWVIPSTDFRRPRTKLEDFRYPQTRPRSRAIYSAKSWLSAFMTRGWHTPLSDEYADIPGREILRANLEALGAALNQLRDAAVPVIVVALPDDAGYGRLAEDVRAFSVVASTAGATFVDLGPVFRLQPHNRLFHDGVHLDVEGHHVVAGALVEVIRDAITDSDETAFKSAALSGLS